MAQKSPRDLQIESNSIFFNKINTIFKQHIEEYSNCDINDRCKNFCDLIKMYSETNQKLLHNYNQQFNLLRKIQKGFRDESSLDDVHHFIEEPTRLFKELSQTIKFIYQIIQEIECNITYCSDIPIQVTFSDYYFKGSSQRYF